MKVSGVLAVAVTCMALSAGRASAAPIILTGSGFSIADGGTATDTVSNLQDGVITDVTLTLFGLTHQAISDLTVTVSFGGTTGTAFSRVPGFDDLDGTFAFNDAFTGDLWATSATPGVTLILGGDYFATGSGSSAAIPFSSLWDGLSPVGVWTLTINDRFAGDIGALEGWQLEIALAETSTPVPEPATLGLLGSSLLGLMAMRRRSRRRDDGSG